MLFRSREALAVALYANGDFEQALVQFHRVYKIRCTPHFEEWISRCEETIESYLTNCIIQKHIIEEITKDNQPVDYIGDTDLVFGDVKVELEARCKEVEAKAVDEKVNAMVMGKLSDDMKFLDHLASHPALKENIFSKEQREKDNLTDEKILNTIQGKIWKHRNFM